jgi:hypothetical protein
MARGKKSEEKLVNKNISMTRSLAEWLRCTAFEERRSQAQVVHDALQEYRARLDNPHFRKRRGSSPDSVGSGSSPDRPS